MPIVFFYFTDYGRPRFTFWKTLANVLIVPMNYHMFMDLAILTKPKIHSLIQPVWSLGLELQAYLILPFIIRFKTLKVGLAILSMGVFVLSVWHILEPSNFGYRLLPGTFYVFIAGSCIYKTLHAPKTADLFDRLFPPLLYGLCILAMLFFGMKDWLYRGVSDEVLVGILMGIPATYYLGKSKVKLPFNHFLGNISYGVFLCHFLVIRFIKVYYPHLEQGSSYQFYVFELSVLIAVVGVLLVEKQAMRVRRKLTVKRWMPVEQKKNHKPLQITERIPPSSLTNVPVAVRIPMKPSSE